MRGRVLIIAGSDSGGGAGIQADIKTVTALGGYAATAVTALTAQNTMGVFGVHEVPPAFVRQQIEVVLEDIGADALKTGMLGNAGIIVEVAKAIAAAAAAVPLVVDPVMVAKGGHKLLDDMAHDALRRLLIPRAAVVTPNIPEAVTLTGLAVRSTNDMIAAGRAILAMGAKAALVKGGHLDQDEELRDVLVTAESVETFAGARLATTSTHGTGCTLASAVATGLAQGMSLHDAATRAVAYVREAIARAPGYGHGHGPLDHGHTLRP